MIRRVALVLGAALLLVACSSTDSPPPRSPVADSPTPSGPAAPTGTVSTTAKAANIAHRTEFMTMVSDPS